MPETCSIRDTFRCMGRAPFQERSLADPDGGGHGRRTSKTTASKMVLASSRLPVTSMAVANCTSLKNGRECCLCMQCRVRPWRGTHLRHGPLSEADPTGLDAIAHDPDVVHDASGHPSPVSPATVMTTPSDSD